MRRRICLRVLPRSVSLMNLLSWVLVPIAVAAALAVLIALLALGAHALLPSEHPARARLLTLAGRSPHFAALIVRTAGSFAFWVVVVLFTLITLAYA
jgi:hypothetical protein